MDCESYCELTAEFRDDLRTLIGASSNNTDDFVLGSLEFDQARQGMLQILCQLTQLQKKYRKMLNAN